MKTKHFKMKAGIFLAVFMLLVTSSISAITSNSSITQCVEVPSQYQKYTYDILWRREWHDGDYVSTHGSKSVVDNNNNIITWVESAAFDKTYFTKYDTNGNQLWMWQVTLDDLENITSFDLYEGGQGGTMRGNEIGEPTINFRQEVSPVENTFFRVEDIKVDSLNNIYMMVWYVERFEAPQIVKTVLLKYNSNGDAIWKNAYTYNNYLVPGMDMVLSPEGYSIYVPCLTFLSGYVLKVDSYDGAVDWFENIKILPFWYPMSIVLDGNNNPLVSSINCLTNPNSPTIQIGLTTLNKFSGSPVADATIEVPLEDTILHDAGLAIDTWNHYVYFGLWSHITCVNAGYEIVWVKQVPPCINDIKIVGGKLITAGGWIMNGEQVHYYAGYYNKQTGATILNMDLGEILYCTDIAFQTYFNQLQSVSIDSQGNFIFSGGQGGMVIIKVKIIAEISFIPWQINQNLNYQIE